MPEPHTLRVERSGGVVEVTLDRPAVRNALNGAMWAELLAVFRDVATSTADRVLVLTGAGGAFCSGADLREPRSGEPLDGMRRVAEVAMALHRLPQPTIAKVTGVAVGAGCNLAFGCDLVVASDDARFSEIFSRRGLSVDCGGSWLLPRRVGLHRAKELAFFADVLSADDAAAMGLVNRVMPLAEVDAFVADWAARLAAGPPIALALTKRLLDDAAGRTMEEALEDEARAQAVNFATADTAEAIAAFVEKREPHFQGR